jgi:ribosomal protein S18 acetylase RimI-like enzyme
MTSFTIHTAQPEEREAALRLVFQHLELEEQDARVANALRLVSSGELDPAGILVLRDKDPLAGALLCLPLPGAGGLIWPPSVKESALRGEKENQLMQTALAWLRSKGVKLVQAILQDQEVQLAGPLLQNGFTHVTRLRYLRHDLQGPVSVPKELAVQTYSQANRGLFQEVLQRTYEGTLDCPELNGKRTVEEIIAGHQAQGEFRPEHWWLASDGSQPIGVLLTSADPAHNWELSYVGVLPTARRRGWGRRLTQLAIAEAQAAGAKHLTVAVDARNHPAWNLYISLGFEATGEREVFLRFLPPTGG